MMPLCIALDAPATPGAQPGVAKLMNFLNSIQGNYILSGQQERAWDPNGLDFDVNYIISTTGKTPAVRGFDFLEYVYSPSQRAGQNATERAIAWARNGGIVTFCCHMFMTIGSPSNNPQFYVPSANGGVGTTFDIRQAVISGTPENTEYLAKLDIIAAELTKLRDAGVPVIWRPFHECSGGWFWWGANGPTACIQAYRIMFDRFTNLHGLNNLIWCYNPTDSSTKMTAWYPGDDVVDMTSLDFYPSGHPTMATDYAQMRTFKNGRKVVAMSENGAIPDPVQLFSGGANAAGWSYFCTWNGFENDTSKNSVAFVQSVYSHPNVITLENLPSFYVAFPQTSAPVITLQPVAGAVAAGASVTLSVAASGTPAPTYQWKKDGVNIGGATGNTYTIAGVAPGDAGSYTAIATNSAGSATSNAAALTIIVAPSSAVISITVE